MSGVCFAGEEDGWVSVIRRLPSENEVCEVHTIYGHVYEATSLCNGEWNSDGTTVDMVDLWRVSAHPASKAKGEG